jgi:hypothetical protein
MATKMFIAIIAVQFEHIITPKLKEMCLHFQSHHREYPRTVASFPLDGARIVSLQFSISIVNRQRHNLRRDTLSISCNFVTIVLGFKQIKT